MDKKVVEKVGEFLTKQSNAKLIEDYVISLGENLHKQYYSIDNKKITEEEKMREMKKVTAKIEVYRELVNEMRKLVNEYVRGMTKEEREKKKVEIVA